MDDTTKAPHGQAPNDLGDDASKQSKANGRDDDRFSRASTRDDIIRLVKSLDPEGDFDAITERVPRVMSRLVLRDAELDNIFSVIARLTKVKAGTVRATYKKALADRDGSVPESIDLKIARAVKKECYGEGQDVIFNEQAVRAWNGGFWQVESPYATRKHIHAAAEGLGSGDVIKKGLVESTLSLFKTEVFSPVQFDPIGTFINAKNGEVHLGDDGRWAMRPGDRAHYRTSQIPVNFEPGAQCPVFEAFLEGVFRGDYDAEEKRQALLEMMGYTMLATTIYDKYIFLLGSGSNGKTVGMNTLAALLGSHNVCAVQPCQFGSRFQRGHMLDKLANIITEMTTGEAFDDGIMKNLVSGEPMTAEHKQEHPFTFRNHATMWLSANDLPKVNDFSDGLFRRTLILEFNRAFGPEKGKPISATSVRLADENAISGLREVSDGRGPLFPELSGILNLCLEALAGVMERGFIITPPSSAVKLVEWHGRNDVVSAFVRDACTLDASLRSQATALYQVFCRWAREKGVSVVSQSMFSRRLDLASGVKSHKSNGLIYYHGVAVRLPSVVRR